MITEVAEYELAYVRQRLELPPRTVGSWWRPRTQRVEYLFLIELIPRPNSFLNPLLQAFGLIPAQPPETKPLTLTRWFESAEQAVEYAQQLLRDHHANLISLEAKYFEVPKDQDRNEEGPVRTDVTQEAVEAAALLDDAIARVPKIGGAGAIYEAELLTVLRKARAALDVTVAAEEGPVSDNPTK